MEVNFNKKQILHVYTNLQKYGTLCVTTQGQMFKSEEMCREALLLKNTIIDDANNFAGYVKLSSESLSADVLRAVGKDITIFNALFKDAKIPTQKVEKVAKNTRTYESSEGVDKKVVDEAAALLGMNDTKKAKTETAETKVDAKTAAIEKAKADGVLK